MDLLEAVGVEAEVDPIPAPAPDQVPAPAFPEPVVAPAPVQAEETEYNFSLFSFSALNMDIPHRDLATTRAAELVLNELQKQLKDPQTPIKLVIQALIPVFGIRWDSRVIHRVGAGRLRHILWSLRNSALPVAEYNRVKELWVSAEANDTSFPHTWGDWQAIIERFNLDDEMQLSEWIAVIDTCVKQGWKTPAILAKVDATTFSGMASLHKWNPCTFQLWKASVILFANTSEGEVLALKGASADAELLISKLKIAYKAERAVSRDLSNAVSKLRLPVSFSSLGPAAKLAKLRKANVNNFKIRRFFRVKAQKNALTGVRFCFGSFTSAIRCYYNFCELRETPPFPVKAISVIEWSSIFNPGATFNNYVNYLKKACFYLDQPIDWATPAVSNIIKGLRLAGKAKLRFPNFIDSSLVVAIMKHEGKSEFAQLAFLSFLFALRVPSEALTLERAYKRDELSDFLPIKGRALIGLRGPEGQERLIIRLARRKNLPQGCIMARPCFCELSSEIAHQLCPVHFFWPLVTQRVRSGEKLFPSYSATKANNALKAILTKLNVTHANKYSSHGFRRGAANELKATGSQWSTIATIGGWKSLAFKGYVDLTTEVDRDMAKLLIETDQLDSETELEVRLWVQGPGVFLLGRTLGVRALQLFRVEYSVSLLFCLSFLRETSI